MADDTSGVDPRSRHRIRWARTGNYREDDGLNTLLSLWLDGFLTPVQMRARVRKAAVAEGIRRQRHLNVHNFQVVATATAIDAHWIVMMGIVDYCDRCQMTSRAKRFAALRRFSDRLNRLGEAAPDQPASWMSELLHRAGVSPAGQEFDDSLHRWLKGESDHKQLQRDIDAAWDATVVGDDALRSQFLIAAQADPAFDLICLGVRACFARCLLDYCQSNDVISEHRQRIYDDLSASLARFDDPDQFRSR